MPIQSGRLVLYGVITMWMRAAVQLASATASRFCCARLLAHDQIIAALEDTRDPQGYSKSNLTLFRNDRWAT